MEKYTDSKVATCLRCGLQKISDTGHDQSCFGICTNETKKMRSHEEISERLKFVSTCNDKFHIYELQALKWVLGDETL